MIENKKRGCHTGYNKLKDAALNVYGTKTEKEERKSEG